jgi:coatomer protein complex subunit epsilon
MDPFSAEGGKVISPCCDNSDCELIVTLELLNLQNAFHQGQYQNVIDFDTSSLSPANSLSGRVLQLRAQIASGQAEDVIAQVEGEDQKPDLVAVKALAQHALGSGALKEVEQLISTSPENQTVQVLAATVLQSEGRSEDALNLLAKHQGNLEA